LPVAPIALAAAALLTSGGGLTAAPAGARPGRDARLSDERTVTRWAHPRERAQVRTHPWRTSRAFTRLHPITEDGVPEVYVTLRSHIGRDGRQWLRVRLPMRPNGRRGWVPRSALGRLHVVRTQLVVDRRRFTAVLRRRGRVIWRSRIGVGAPGTPTPHGRFYIRELLQVPTPSGIYGPYAFGTSAYSVLSDWPGGGVVGIHGTNAPALIPGRPSHGCIRVPNPAIRRLARMMPIGTPVRII
jgi:hypothetical protein